MMQGALFGDDTPIRTPAPPAPARPARVGRPVQLALLADPHAGQHAGQLAVADLLGGTRTAEAAEVPDVIEREVIRCRRCERELTDAQSRRDGIGPDCAELEGAERLQGRTETLWDVA